MAGFHASWMIWPRRAPLLSSSLFSNPAILRQRKGGRGIPGFLLTPHTEFQEPLLRQRTCWHRREGSCERNENRRKLGGPGAAETGASFGPPLWGEPRGQPFPPTPRGWCHPWRKSQRLHCSLYSERGTIWDPRASLVLGPKWEEGEQCAVGAKEWG